MSCQPVAYRFLNHFFGEYLRNHRAFIVICSSIKKGGWQQQFHTDIYAASHCVADTYLQGYDAYFGVNPYKRPSRKQNAIKDILRLHVDADFKDEKGLSRLLALEPTVVIASGTKHRYHAYWDFQEPLSRELHGNEITLMNRQLTRILGIDEEAFDITRVLRIPGTANFKNRNNPRPVEIIGGLPERKYTLEQCADLLDVNLKLASASNQQPATGQCKESGTQRGRYLSPKDRAYVDELLRDGLFEEHSRNRAMKLLIRHYYEFGYSQEEVQAEVVRFFENLNNGLSGEWNENPDSVRAKIRYAVKNWFNKAYTVGSLDSGKALRLNRRDDEFISKQNLKERDKRFLRDAMTWIVNNKRGDDIILSVRQLAKFENCNRRNYKAKRQILIDLGIISLAVEHNYKDRLANEYKVLYKFHVPTRVSNRGRKRTSDVNISDEIGEMIRAGANSKEIRIRFPCVTRQRIYNRRKRMDEQAVRSRELNIY